MKKRNFLITMVLLLAVSLVLAACGEEKTGGNESKSGDKKDEKFMKFLTGGTGGTYYPLGGAIAKVISDETDYQPDAISSNASADNVAELAKGNAQLAFVQTDVMSYAVEGIHAFDGEPVDNVLALGSLYPETIQIVTTPGSGIKSVEDMKGKKISVGAPGSGTYINAEQILEIHGMTMEDIKAQNLDFDESTSGIQDGTIDAAFITAGTPTGSVEGLSATNEVSIVPIEKDKVDELVKTYPFYAAETIPAGTYGLKEDVDSVAVLAMVAVVDSLSEDAVYEMTKALYENTDKIAHDRGESITLETALDGIGIDLHPGAEKYFKEEGLID
ncbi:MAG TPA: TAXI family TRAP transporter solute-binding subunit [Cerasibacillus sp.]|uniref:TAXI family TRAP transporter solute-binding subunit n=1 Tax=Cerasibacillus sp. TaxID=2498711 RepID=UPI002F430179